MIWIEIREQKTTGKSNVVGRGGPAYGVRLVLVLGVKEQVDDRLRALGAGPRYVRGYRITDTTAMRVALEQAAFMRTQVEAALSKVCRRFLLFLY